MSSGGGHPFRCIVGAVLIASTGACTAGGGGKGLDLSKDERPYAVAIGRAIAKDTPAIARRDRTCAGGAILRTVGLAKARARGLTTEKVARHFDITDLGVSEKGMTSAELERFMDALKRCGLVRELAASLAPDASTESLRGSKARKIERCIAGKLSDKEAERVLRLQLGRADPEERRADPVLIPKLKACGGKPYFVP